MLIKTIIVVKKKMETVTSLEELVKQKPLAKWEIWGEFLTFLNINSWTEKIYNNY